MQSKIGGIESQLDALAEHLTRIPKNVSPVHIFSQMEKLQAFKESIEKDLGNLEESGESYDLPVELKTYQEFLNAIAHGMGSESDALFKQKVI